MDAWDEFWAGGGHGDVAVRSEALNAELFRFWDGAAGEAVSSAKDAVIGDFACGAGVVTRSVLQAADRLKAPVNMVALDRSAAAVAQLSRELGDRIAPVVADGGAVPFASGQFSAIFSQFGIEYAGEAALEAMPALLAEDGRLVALCHARGSAIWAECEANLKILTAAKDNELISRARALFVDRSAGNMDIESEASRAYGAAVIATRDVAKANVGAAAHYAARVTTDIEKLLLRFENFKRGEALAWFDAQNDALNAYHGRMAAMTKAALSDEAAERLTAKWSADGLEIRELSKRYFACDKAPLAWCIDVQRKAA